MDKFDLGRLTSYDFEAVCRDLFSELPRAQVMYLQPVRMAVPTCDSSPMASSPHRAV